MQKYKDMSRSREGRFEKFLTKNILIIFMALVIFGLIIVVAVHLMYFYNFDGHLSENQSVWGAFGDYLGGVLNPVLGFLGLMALLITMVLQSRELSLSAEELRRSASALENQNASIELQRFENIFFNMLRLHNDIVKDMQLERVSGEEVGVEMLASDHYSIVYNRPEGPDARNVQYTGRECLRHFNMVMVHTYTSIERQLPQSDPRHIIEVSYKTFLCDYGLRIGHYFRNLFHIVKMIDKKEGIDKKKYIRIVRAQLSSVELNLLFYNSFSTQGAAFKPLVERYALLKNFDPVMCIRPFTHIRLYEDSAFGGRKGLEEYYS